MITLPVSHYIYKVSIETHLDVEEEWTKQLRFVEIITLDTGIKFTKQTKLK